MVACIQPGSWGESRRADADILRSLVGVSDGSSDVPGLGVKGAGRISTLMAQASVGLTVEIVIWKPGAARVVIGVEWDKVVLGNLNTEEVDERI